MAGVQRGWRCKCAVQLHVQVFGFGDEEDPVDSVKICRTGLATKGRKANIGIVAGRDGGAAVSVIAGVDGGEEAGEMLMPGIFVADRDVHVAGKGAGTAVRVFTGVDGGSEAGEMLMR